MSDADLDALNALRARLNAQQARLDAHGREIITPAMDMCENSECYRLKCDLPGLDKDNIRLECLPGKLLLRAEADLCPPPGMKVHALEFCSPAYHLELALPPDVDEKRLDAGYIDGVLILTLPKKKQSLGRRIAVSGSN